MTGREIEAGIKILLIKKNPGPDGSLQNSIKCLKNRNHNFSNYSNIEKEGILLNSQEASKHYTNNETR